MIILINHFSEALDAVGSKALLRIVRASARPPESRKRRQNFCGLEVAFAGFPMNRGDAFHAFLGEL